MGSHPHLALTPAAAVGNGARCRLDRMAGASLGGDARGMHVTPTSEPRERAPDNELYDRGADLVEAATAIRRVAGSPDAGRAVPAVLGCMESALQELVLAAAALEETTAEVAAGTPGRRADRVVARMHRGFTNLQDALFDAHTAAAAARSLASRALGRAAKDPD
jgi:hypothetical protein